MILHTLQKTQTIQDFADVLSLAFYVKIYPGI
jgi:hypothetical protein